jgi:hypothetical protein
VTEPAARREPDLPVRDPIELGEPEYTRLMDARKIVQAALDDRRDKAWRIFSWASSILLGVAAGATALFAKEGQRFPLWPHGAAMIVAVAALAVYACLWVRENQRLAAAAGKIVGDYDRMLGINTGFTAKKIRVGYVATLVLLALAASVAVLATAERGAAKPAPSRPAGK